MSNFNMKKNRRQIIPMVILAIGLLVVVFTLSILGFTTKIGTGNVRIGYYIETEYGDRAIYSESDGVVQIIFLYDDTGAQNVFEGLQTGDRIEIRFGDILCEDENGIYHLPLQEKIRKRVKWFHEGSEEVSAVNEQAALLHR